MIDRKSFQSSQRLMCRGAPMVGVASARLRRVCSAYTRLATHHGLPHMRGDVDTVNHQTSPTFYCHCRRLMEGSVGKGAVAPHSGGA